MHTIHNTRPSQAPTIPAPPRARTATTVPAPHRTPQLCVHPECLSGLCLLSAPAPEWRPLRDLAVTGACLVLAALITALALIFGGS
jgi:hypothetical protein